MSKGSDSTSSSTRTFMPSKPDKASQKPPKKPLKLPKLKLPTAKVRLPGSPWLLVFILVLVSAFMYMQYHDAKQKLQSNDVAKTNQQMLTKLQKVIVLPTSETPTFATVKDVAALKAQSNFFSGAQNGDKLIIYSKQNKALLYRPSTNLIVNFSTSLKITTGNSANQSLPSN
jgi:hypothetical protein